MQKYILKRYMQYTERAEIEALDWNDAMRQFRDPDTEFERMEDDHVDDESAEYIGDTE